VQVSSLSLSCVLVSTVSLNSGLTYYNMLAICFVANVVYLVICAVPQVRRAVFGALPAPVRAALPAAAGLLLAWIAAQLTGLFSVTSSLMPNYGTASNLGTGYVALSGMTNISDFSYTTDAYHPQMLISAIAVVLTFAVFLYGRGKKTPYGKALAIGTVFFLAASVLACGVNWKNFNFALSFLWGRLWMAGSEDAMQAHLSAAIANLGIGKVFTQGFDFSGFTGNGGNLAVLFGSSLLSYVFMFAADAQSTVDACDTVASRGSDEPVAENTGLDLVLISNGAANVVSAVLGASPVAVGKESVAGARDRARSGLAAVVAAVVFAVSAVVWVVPTLCATITSYSISFNLYGHYGYCMQLLAQTSFSVADAVMVIVGLGMAMRAVTIDVRDAAQVAPFAATVAGAVLTTNLAVGVAAGVVAHVLANVAAPRRKKGQPKSSLVERVGGVPTLVLAAVSVVLLVLVAW
jgi:adenine/guanine/hypoxanthine permease